VLSPARLAAERDFQARFGKLVAAARYSKKESKEAEAGMLALDALHKQVMPFILRRTKAQVLQDLPPKIVTDVMCSLSAIQHALYEDFQESQVGMGCLWSARVQPSSRCDHACWLALLIFV
jgi:TATA-binding protein-associated factor